MNYFVKNIKQQRILSVFRLVVLVTLIDLFDKTQLTVDHLTVAKYRTFTQEANEYS